MHYGESVLATFLGYAKQIHARLGAADTQPLCPLKTEKCTSFSGLKTLRHFSLSALFSCYHVTEYCAVIGAHSTVRDDKLLYGHVPDPFPRCRIGSGHARLAIIKVTGN